MPEADQGLSSVTIVRGTDLQHGEVGRNEWILLRKGELRHRFDGAPSFEPGLRQLTEAVLRSVDTLLAVSLALHTTPLLQRT